MCLTKQGTGQFSQICIVNAHDMRILIFAVVRKGLPLGTEVAVGCIAQEVAHARCVQVCVLLNLPLQLALVVHACMCDALSVHVRRPCTFTTAHAIKRLI